MFVGRFPSVDSRRGAGAGGGMGCAASGKALVDRAQGPVPGCPWGQGTPMPGAKDSP